MGMARFTVIIRAEGGFEARAKLGRQVGMKEYAFISDTRKVDNGEFAVDIRMRIGKEDMAWVIDHDLSRWERRNGDSLVRWSRS